MSKEMKIQEDITRNQHRLTNHLVEQNKRYREALEEIKSHQVVGVANWGIEYAKLQKIAHEALEGE